jgi:murein L,D-transpeptidase YcbB/YkuD
MSCVIIAGLWTIPAAELSAGGVEEKIAALVATSGNSDGLSGTQTALDAAMVIPRLYQQRDYRPAWFGTHAVDELFQALNNGIAQGFQPSDFHLPQLIDLHDAAKSGGDEDVAAFDVLASDAATKLASYLFFGKVDPGAVDSGWNFDKPVIKRDPATVINQYLNGDGFSALIELITIHNAQYQQLVDALAQYRKIAFSGGWPKVPDSETIKPGRIGSEIAQLRERLAGEGVLNEGQILPAVEDSETDPAWVYDAHLQADVEAFQTRHGLAVDGVIGPKTFVNLNRTAQERVDQLRLSLERGRWLMRDLDEEFVLVNIAGARTYMILSDGSVWTTRSITGSQYRKTPVFRDNIKYMEFNPTWTVPNSILRKDKLARIRKDSGYLSRNGYSVRDKNGSEISASAVDWSSSNPAVTLVQRPGPNNALGLVKFMFPNAHAVYLHDTNDHSLFDRNERNLSSGCVRLEQPFEFASLLMEGAPGWSAEKMQSILKSGKTTRVDLPEPMPVLLTYWTAWVEEGEVHFREDIYERDGPILAALNR